MAVLENAWASAKRLEQFLLKLRVWRFLPTLLAPLGGASAKNDKGGGKIVKALAAVRRRGKPVTLKRAPWVVTRHGATRAL